MSFIRGRYHINPIMGEALEAARDAEAALLAMKQSGRRNGGSAPGYNSGYQSGDQSGDDSAAETDDNARTSAAAQKGPVHRVEIEAAEMVPSHSGRAQRGYAMRLHRLPPPNGDSGVGSQFNSGSDSTANSYGSSSRMPSRNTASAGAAQSDTHIFANPGDMLDFLRAELANDSANQ